MDTAGSKLLDGGGRRIICGQGNGESTSCPDPGCDLIAGHELDFDRLALSSGSSCPEGSSQVGDL